MILDRAFRVLTVVAALVATCNGALPASADVYELRTYTTNDGKLPALHQRFSNHTMRIFEKHGMQNVSYWIPANKPNTLIYVIAHKDADAAKANWEGFLSDPKWQEVYTASIANGRLVNKIDSVLMTKTPYSP